MAQSMGVGLVRGPERTWVRESLLAFLSASPLMAWLLSPFRCLPRCPLPNPLRPSTPIFSLLGPDPSSLWGPEGLMGVGTGSPG